ncbi:aldo/keto reductase [Streptomyces sp. NPDC090022]|uniref:aldo/keto reductase n=1 Tax=Streptomyces sp. NPDC090022 TaxID=3365920 RepID=UPI003809123D
MAAPRWWRAGRRKLFDLYVEHGGDFIDTADTYTDGSSESLLGEFTRDNRESLVLATEYATHRRPGDPNAGGPHRKNLFASVESSLRRLNTDCIDLLYLHVWDGDLRGWSPPVALQIEYSLIQRAGDRDLIPMAREMGLGVVPYSPTADPRRVPASASTTPWAGSPKAASSSPTW